MRPKFKTRLAGLFVIALVAAGLAMPTSAAAAAGIPVSRTDVSDVAANETISHKDGSVTVATCSSASPLYSTKTFTGTGSLRGSTGYLDSGPYHIPEVFPCDSQKAVAKDGTIYGDDATQTNVERVTAYTPAGVRKWVRSLAVPGCASGTNLLPQYFRMGSDNNLYVVGIPRWGECGGQHYLYSFKPNGTLRWQIAVGSSVSFMNTYTGNGAGVLVFTNSTAKHYDYSGTPKVEVPVAEPNAQAVGSNAAGMLVVVSYAYVTTECGWTDSRIVTRSISGYTLTGRTLYYQPPCSYANAVTALQNGGVAYNGDGYVDSINRVITLTYSATTGATTAKQILVWPDSDGQRQFFGGSGIIAETNGNILTFRRYTREGGKYRGMQFVLVRVADGARTTVFNTDSLSPTMSHNVSEESISLSPSRLHFTTIECGGWSCSTLDPYVLYSVPMAEMGMDYPRGTTLGVAKIAFDVLANVGDSFSSGLGSLNSGEAYLHTACERSPNAYGLNLDADPTVALQMPSAAFLACSGAETPHLLGTRFKGQAPQIGKIPVGAKVVVLSVGGNDAKFPRLAKLCIFVDCSTQAYQDEFNGYLSGLEQKLAQVYQAILARASDAHVYVVGYPHILPLGSCGDAGEPGWWAALRLKYEFDREGYRQAVINAGLSPAEADDAATSVPDVSDRELIWGNTFENRINLKVSDGVDLANAAVPGGRLHFVSTTLPGSPFENRQLCSETEYFNGFDPLTPANTFHPNFLGQIALYEVVRGAVAAHQPQYVLG